MKMGVLLFIFIAFSIFKAMILGTPTSFAGTPTLDNINPVKTICVDILSQPLINNDGSNRTMGEVFSHCLFDGFNTNLSCSWWNLVCIAGSIASATFDVAIAILDLVICVAVLVLVIVNIIIFIVQLIIFVGILTFTSIPDAPIYINLLLLGLPAILLLLAIIDAFKPGADSS